MKEKFKKYWYVVLILIVILIYYVVDESSSNVKFDVVKEDVLVEKEVVEENNSITLFYVDIKGEVNTPGVYEIESNKRVIDVIIKAGGLTKNADTSLLNLSKKIKDEMSIRIYSKTEVKRAKENVNKEPEVIEIIKEIEKECVCPDVNEVCTSINDAVIDKINGTLEEDKDETQIDQSEIEDKKPNEEENAKTEENTSNKKEEESNKDVNDKLVNINTATKEELMTIPNIGESKANSIIEYRNQNRFKNIEDILNVSGIGQSIFDKIKEFITV